MKKTKLTIAIIWIATILVVGGGAFWGGMKYGQNKRPSGPGNIPNGMQLGNRNGQGNGMIDGEIISTDDKSITVKDKNGSSKTIYFSDSTTISKSTDGSKSDLTNGKTVMASGSSNSDGSITAKNIQIR